MKSSAYMYTELKKIINDITVKYRNKGDLYDEHSIDAQRGVDEYILAKEKSDRFEVTRKYKPEAVLRSGLTSDNTLATIYSKEPASIPEEWRDKVHQAQRDIIIEEYVEENEYYRMLSGVPPLEMNPLNYAFASEDFYEKYNLEFLPVHELEPYHCTLLMNDTKEWNQLLEMYDAKNVRWYEYLYHIGSKSVDPYYARQALNFQILYVNTKNVDSKILEDFLKYYEQNREYTMTILYNLPYSLKYSLYDEYMAFMVIVMTIQRVIVNQFKNGIEREFYDLSTLKTLMECYNIPFIERLPIDKQRMIAKNLNKLLYYKSSDKVIYDISAILGFDKLSVHKYLLVKQHRYDEDGNPRFIYKTELDEEGNEVQVYDYESMFEIYFQSVDLKERDIPQAIKDPSNRIDYEWVTDGDLHWWGDDPELLDHLYKDEYNYIETKYLHMNVMYKLTEMLFETTTFLRMILENEDQTSTVNVDMPKLSLNTTVSMYDSILALATLICHRHGMKGEFIYGPTRIFSVLGFNFAEELTKLKQYIRESGAPDYKIIEEYIRDMNVNSLSDINRVLGNIEDLREYLTLRTREAKTIEEYRTYRNLYRTLLLSEENEELYKLKDATNAVTVKELLQDRRPDLYETIMELDPVEDSEKITELSEHIIYRLQDLIENLDYLYYVSSDSNIMVEALRKLISFFKSYTVDLRDFNILYLVDSRFHNRILLLDEIHRVDMDVTINDDSWSRRYIDILMADIDIKIIDSLSPKERMDIISKIFLISNIKMRDMIKLVDIKTVIQDKTTLMRYIDELSMDVKVDIRDEIKYKEYIKKLYTILLVMYIKSVEEIRRVDILVDSRDRLYTIDIISQSISRVTFKEEMNFGEQIKYITENSLRDNIVTNHVLKTLLELEIVDRLYTTDIIHIIEQITSIYDEIVLREYMSRELTDVKLVERLNMEDKINRMVNEHKLREDYKLYGVISDMNFDMDFKDKVNTRETLDKQDSKTVFVDRIESDTSVTLESIIDLKSSLSTYDDLNKTDVEFVASQRVKITDQCKYGDIDKSASDRIHAPMTVALIDTEMRFRNSQYTSSEIKQIDIDVTSPMDKIKLHKKASNVMSSKLSNTNIDVVDNAKVDSSISHKDRIRMRDTFRIVYS